MNTELLELERLLKYDSIVQIWKLLCERHTELFDLTCEEYSLLLGSDLDSLEAVIAEKEIIISSISDIEEKRQELINEINQKNLYNKQVASASELIKAMSMLKIEKESKHLEKFNDLLIGIIERIQEQNKKNKIFLNKALHNINEIKASFSGKKNYKTYDAFGAAKRG
jgi:flagellar biosynthesis/type III secretory pathway chaperone